MRYHAGKCKWRDDYLIEKILDVRGPTHSARQEFLITWKGYGQEHDSWQPRKNIDPESVTEFLKANDLYDYGWAGERCPYCDLPCKSSRGVKIHLRACRCVLDEQSFTGTLADRKVRRNKMAKPQAHFHSSEQCKQRDSPATNRCSKHGTVTVLRLNRTSRDPVQQSVVPNCRK